MTNKTTTTTKTDAAISDAIQALTASIRKQVIAAEKSSGSRQGTMDSLFHLWLESLEDKGTTLPATAAEDSAVAQLATNVIALFPKGDKRNQALTVLRVEAQRAVEHYWKEHNDGACAWKIGIKQDKEGSGVVTLAEKAKRGTKERDDAAPDTDGVDATAASKPEKLSRQIAGLVASYGALEVARAFLATPGMKKSLLAELEISASRGSAK